MTSTFHLFFGGPRSNPVQSFEIYSQKVKKPRITKKLTILFKKKKIFIFVYFFYRLHTGMYPNQCVFVNCVTVFYCCKKVQLVLTIFKFLICCLLLSCSWNNACWRLARVFFSLRFNLVVCYCWGVISILYLNWSTRCNYFKTHLHVICTFFLLWSHATKSYSNQILHFRSAIAWTQGELLWMVHWHQVHRVHSLWILTQSVAFVPITRM